MVSNQSERGGALARRFASAFFVLFFAFLLSFMCGGPWAAEAADDDMHLIVENLLEDDIWVQFSSFGDTELVASRESRNFYFEELQKIWILDEVDDFLPFYSQENGGVWELHADGQMDLTGKAGEIHIQVKEIEEEPEPAQWVVSYWVDDAEVARETVTNGALASGYLAPEKEGMDFVGWYDGGTAFSFETPITRDIVLAARYQPKEWTVTYYVNGEVWETARVKHGEYAEDKVPDVQMGMDFIGWYDGGTAFSFETPITRNIVLTARYQAKEWTVTYYCDEKIWDTRKVKHGEFAEEIAPQEQPGMEFTGWYNGEEKFDFGIPINSDLDLKAKYIVKEWTVIFTIDVGVFKSVKVKHGSLVHKEEAPEKDGMDFIGWYLGEAEFDFETPITRDVTLVAKYQAKIWTVSFRINGEVLHTESVPNGERVEAWAPPTAETGMVFDGWYCGETKYDFTQSVTAHITLDGIYVAEKYQIRFIVRGRVYLELTVTHGEKATMPEDPEVEEGERFLGWYDGDALWDGIATGNIDLVAKFEKPYQVELIADGERYMVDYGREFFPTAPAREGYVFLGWFLDAEFTQAFDGSVKAPYGESIILYGSYRVEWVYVTAIVRESRYEYRLAYGEEWDGDVPMPEGHYVQAWLYEGAVWQGGAITENITLVAVLEKLRYTVIFEVNGAQTETEWEYGSTPVPPERTEEEERDKRIVGWEPAIAEVRGEQTYVAITVELYHKEYFDGDTKLFEEYVAWTESEAPDLEKEGYLFLRYRLTEQNGKHLVYVAEFARLEYTVWIQNADGVELRMEKQQYYFGEEVYIQIILEENYRIISILLNGEAQPIAEELRFLMPATHITVSIATESMCGEAGLNLSEDGLLEVEGDWGQIAAGYSVAMTLGITEVDVTTEAIWKESDFQKLRGFSIRLAETESGIERPFSNGAYLTLKIKLDPRPGEALILMYEKDGLLVQEEIMQTEEDGQLITLIRIYSNGNYYILEQIKHPNQVNAMLIVLCVALGILVVIAAFYIVHLKLEQIRTRNIKTKW